MPITEQQLLQILPKARPVAGIFLPALNRAMKSWRRAMHGMNEMTGRKVRDWNG